MRPIACLCVLVLLVGVTACRTSDGASTTSETSSMRKELREEMVRQRRELKEAGASPEALREYDRSIQQVDKALQQLEREMRTVERRMDKQSP